MTHTNPVTYSGALLGGIILFGIILTALAWNDAIQSSINRGLEGGDRITGDVLTGKWVYAVIAAIVMIVILWFAHSKMAGDYYVHKNGGQLPPGAHGCGMLHN